MKPTLLIAAFAFGVVCLPGSQPAEASLRTALPKRPHTHDQAGALGADTLGADYASLQSAEASAQEFISHAGLDRNLSLLLLHDVKESDTVRAAIRRYGMDKVQNTVIRAIRSAHGHHAIGWINVMAKVYAGHFGASELGSLAREKENSPYFNRLVDLQAVISEEVQAEGAPIISAARSEVLSRLSADLPL